MRLLWFSPLFPCVGLFVFLSYLGHFGCWRFGSLDIFPPSCGLVEHLFSISYFTWAPPISLTRRWSSLLVCLRFVRWPYIAFGWKRFTLLIVLDRGVSCLFFICNMNFDSVIDIKYSVITPTTRLESTLKNRRLVHFQHGIHPREVHMQKFICIVEYKAHLNIAHPKTDRRIDSTFDDDITLHMFCCCHCFQFGYPSGSFLRQSLCKCQFDKWPCYNRRIRFPPIKDARLNIWAFLLFGSLTTNKSAS